MRKLIAICLVFITTFLKGQSVDPETFPTVVGAISGKNLYTNTGGEGKVSIKAIMDSVDILDTATITYADFYTAITGGNLVVGKTYIIMDFQTVYDQMDFDAGGSLKPTLVTKTGATEQIWVLALSSNQIAKKAYSATYPNDQIQYDWTYNTTLVNGSPAKGRITERIDEWNNRTDYDHRAIKFIRYDDGAGNFTVINDNGNASQEFLTFGNTYGTNTGEIIKNNYIGDYYTYNSFYGQEYSNNVIHASTISIRNIFGIMCFNNTFGDGNFSNTFGNDNHSNTFGNNNDANTFGNDNHSNTFGNNNDANTFGNDNHSNTFGNDNSFNTFGDINQNNTFTHSTFMRYLNINSNLVGKTIDDITYPIIFNTYFKKEIIQASNGNYYIKTFDGTTDQYILIP